MPGTVPYWENPQSQANWGGQSPYLNSRVTILRDAFSHSSPSLGPHTAGVGAFPDGFESQCEGQVCRLQRQQNSGKHLLNVMVPYSSSIPSITFPEIPCLVSLSFSGHEPPLLESLRLSLGTFNSLCPLLRPSLPTLHYLAHFTDVTTVA